MGKIKKEIRNPKKINDTKKEKEKEKNNNETTYFVVVMIITLMFMGKLSIVLTPFIALGGAFFLLRKYENYLSNLSVYRYGNTWLFSIFLSLLFHLYIYNNPTNLTYPIIFSVLVLLSNIFIKRYLFEVVCLNCNLLIFIFMYVVADYFVGIENISFN